MSQVGMKEAIGSWVLACKAAQTYWKKDALIPAHVAERLQCFEELKSSGWLLKSEAGYYFAGSKKHHDWLLKRKAAGKKGGKSSPKKQALFHDGTNAEEKGTDSDFNSLQTSKRKQTEANGKQTEASTSYSISSNKLLKEEDKSSSFSTEPKKSAQVAAAASNKPKRFNAETLNEVLWRIGDKKMPGWVKLYGDSAWIERELAKAWSYYGEDYPQKKPKSESGWSRALSSWLERGWKDYGKGQGKPKFKTKRDQQIERTQEISSWVNKTKTQTWEGK